MVNLKDTYLKSNYFRAFIGNNASIINEESIAVNNYITAQKFEISYPENMLPEEEGTLYLFPVDDNQFCLQLRYLLYDENIKPNVSVYTIRFLPAFFDQYPAESLMANQPFRFDEVTEMRFPICTLSCTLLGQLQQTNSTTAILASLQNTNTAIQLLQRALACITIPFTVCQVPACRFLAFETERDKIKEACKIIEKDLSISFTIRELSRKVGINECYLKKGFKALTGKTVHEYRENLRIKTAGELLKTGKMSVTDVADALGYSSISHFSTAFKRVTGIKPCELLY